MNIVESLRDPQLLRPFLADRHDDVSSWSAWFTALRVLYGLPVAKSRHELVRQCTGRDPAKLPKQGFDSALFLTGRRSGKSRIVSCIAAHAATMEGFEDRLAPGEVGCVGIFSVSRRQSQIIHKYLSNGIFRLPMFKELLTRVTANGFELENGISVEIFTGDHRLARGVSLILALVDETAFFGVEEGSKVKSDTELVNALLPALATTGGRLIGVSSPYGRTGWCWNTHQRHFGNDASDVLVWNAASRVMNPTLRQSVVDRALAEDYAKGQTEYLAQFRDDVAIWLPREVIEAVVIPDRLENTVRPGTTPVSFCDLSGGRRDAAALSIAHRDGRTVVIDLLRVYKPPHNPHDVVRRMADELRRWGIKRVTGDAYSAEWSAAAWQSAGIRYEKCDLDKSKLYAELIPLICSKEIELLDNDLCIDQLAALERRTRSGGRDIIDHPPGQHDDAANAVAGAAYMACQRRIVCGGFGHNDTRREFTLTL